MIHMPLVIGYVFFICFNCCNSVVTLEYICNLTVTYFFIIINIILPILLWIKHLKKFKTLHSYFEKVSTSIVFCFFFITKSFIL
jgi:hypothetical protein